MHTEDLVVYQRSDGQAVEAVSEDLPQLDSVATLALIVEPVNPIDGGTLVVSSQQEEVLWVFDLVGQQEADGLEGHLSTIDVVS